MYQPTRSLVAQKLHVFAFGLRKVVGDDGEADEDIVRLDAGVEAMPYACRVGVHSLCLGVLPCLANAWHDAGMMMLRLMREASFICVMK